MGITCDEIMRGIAGTTRGVRHWIYSENSRRPEIRRYAYAFGKTYTRNISDDVAQKFCDIRFRVESSIVLFAPLLAIG